METENQNTGGTRNTYSNDQAIEEVMEEKSESQKPFFSEVKNRLFVCHLVLVILFGIMSVLFLFLGNNIHVPDSYDPCSAFKTAETCNQSFYSPYDSYCSWNGVNCSFDRNLFFSNLTLDYCAIFTDCKTCNFFPECQWYSTGCYYEYFDGLCDCCKSQDCSKSFGDADFGVIYS